MRSVPISAYQVGIVCALPKEVAAVLAVLDEEHEPLVKQDANDHNNYILGRIHKHNVAIVCLPAGKYGTTKAATGANNMLRSFPSMRIGLMVGIGGGIPNPPKDDIRLGDVVISQPDGTFGGVIQYDLAKDLGDSGLERKGALDSPPSVLLTALSTLQVRNRGVSTYLKEAASNDSTLAERGYSFPGVEKDQLHCAQCDTSQSWWQRLLVLLLTFLWISSRCTACKNGKVLRKIRTHQNPVIHYGNIASGNLLIKNATLRDRLGREFKAKCVEMEAAGLMDDFRCVVIRGICDYADSYKNDEWQEYAALTAAACAKELLFYLVPERVSEAQPLSDVLGVFKEQISLTKALLEETIGQSQKIETYYQNDLHRKCHQTFKTTAYERFKNINPERVPGTCQWTLNSPAFRQWHDSLNDDLLWISADPGCGKSVLARSLIDNELRDDKKNQKVCYFFFKDNEEQNTLTAALCALLHQLFDLEPHLIKHAVPTWEKNGDKLFTETDELWRIFLTATKDLQITSVTCVLDALDECRGTDRKNLISKLMEWHRGASLMLSSGRERTRRGTVKFLVTSRPYGDIESDFQLPPYLPAIRLRGEDKNDQIHQEINMVIEMRVNEVATQLKLKQSTRDRLKVQLLQMEHRTYLWLYLAIESIYETFKNSFRPDQESVEYLPTTVDDAYETILSRVTDKKRDDVKLVLAIIVGAKRPLTVGEMSIALGIATTHHPTDLASTSIDQNHLREQIRQWCGLFVFVNDSRVYLIHQTAKEFLICKHGLSVTPGTWKYCLELTTVEQVMARICIEFMSFEDVDVVGESVANKWRLRNEDVFAFGELELEDDIECFAAYSAENWASHLRNTHSPIEKSLKAKVFDLYDVSSFVFYWWFTVFWASTGHYSFAPGINSLGLAACNGHLEFVEHFLEDNALNPNQWDVDTNITTALVWASEYNRKTVVELLLSKGADVNAQDNMALYKASIRGHQAIVELLLSSGADIEAHGIFGGPALFGASSGGHQAVAELLINKGANVNAGSGENYGTALCAASFGGHQAVVELLLGKGADVNDQGLGIFGTALCGASSRGHQALVELLLDSGADVDAQGPYGSTALFGASSEGYQAVVELLLSKGADINARGGHGTALCGALAEGHKAVVEFLISEGADVNIGGGLEGTPLNIALSGGHQAVVESLLSKGADINAQGGRYGTALCGASASGHTAVVEFLISKGADVNIGGGGGHYSTALYKASARGHQAVVELLLSKGADINAQGGRYGTALCGASARGHTAVVELLISKGADINAQEGRCGTALCGASAGGHQAVVELLLSKGADVNAQVWEEWHNTTHCTASEVGDYNDIALSAESEKGIYYGTALYRASARGHEAVVELLLREGADVNTHGGLYDTALRAASAGGHKAVVELLLSEGAYVNVDGYHGDAVYVALKEGHPAIAKLLLGDGVAIDFSRIGRRRSL